MLQSLHFSEVPLPAELDGKGSRCLPETLKYPHWGRGSGSSPGWTSIQPAAAPPEWLHPLWAEVSARETLAGLPFLQALWGVPHFLTSLYVP